MPQESGGLTKPQTSVHSPGTVPGRHNGVGPGGIGKSAGKGFFKSTSRLRAVAARSHQRLHVLILHDRATSEKKLLPDSTLLGKIVVNVQRHDREGLLAAARLPTERCS